MNGMKKEDGSLVCSGVAFPRVPGHVMGPTAATSKLCNLHCRYPKTHGFPLSHQVQRSWDRAMVGLAQVPLWTSGRVLPGRGAPSCRVNTAGPDVVTRGTAGGSARYY